MIKTRYKLTSLLLTAAVLTGCGNGAKTEVFDLKEVKPPVAKVLPETLSIHSHDRTDNYFWIRDDDRSDPEVLALLNAENEYTRAAMAHTNDLQDVLFREITARLTTDDSTVPVRRGDFYYHREYREGGEYPIYMRRHTDAEVSEILLDVNQLAEGHEYYQLGNWVVSKDSNVLAYATDDVSRRIYTLNFRDLKTGEKLPDVIQETSASMAWANDNKALYYVQKDPVTLLPFRVLRHELGTPVAKDVVVYEEKDRSFSTSVYKSRSDQYIVIAMHSTDSTELRLINADGVQAGREMQTFLPREADHEYRIRHVSGEFYILTNWQAENFRIMKIADDLLTNDLVKNDLVKNDLVKNDLVKNDLVKNDLAKNKERWQEIIAHRPDVLIQDMEVFNSHLVVAERFDGLTRLRVIDRKTDSEKRIEFPDPAYMAHLHSNPEVDARVLRYVYSSLTTPTSVYEFDMDSGLTKLLKQDEVVGSFESDRYQSERLKIKARDGAEVPVSLVYRKNLKQSGENPLYIYAYGSYGYSTNPGFSALRLSLLDRGFVFAMVHVRGGMEMGRHWYDQGKLLNKRNTFWDFIDATETLVDLGYGNKDRVFAMGGSAGGLLMGVIANEAPEKYLGIIAHVPFVDVVTTMLDESIPLTTGEFAEWGNPKDEEYYQYILSYSPYDQVRRQVYPNMFVTTGLHDSQVQYFEPVKWVSKLRRFKQGNNRLLIDIDMDTGHGGASGRYERYRTDALEYAFVLDVLKRQGWSAPR